MKNYISIIIFIFSTSVFAQSGIENDEMYLKYENSYIAGRSATSGPRYEKAKGDFYASFKNYKDVSKFENSKDKENWLNKNYKKLNVTNANEAVKLYNDYIIIKTEMYGNENDIQNNYNELVKKYGANLVWETLQKRLKERK